MKEYQRQYVIREISKKINEKKSLPAKKVELEELKKDPAVVKYLNLLEEIHSIQRKYKFYNTEEKIIDHVFETIIKEDFKCHHEIWLYEGSYYFTYEYDYLYRKNSEELPTLEGKIEFKYNQYVCLECGEKVETKDWQSFEKSHFVLKNQNEYINIEDYISLYYQTLYDKNVKEAQETVIRTFNIEKAKIKTLKK